MSDNSQQLNGKESSHGQVTVKAGLAQMLKGESVIHTIRCSNERIHRLIHLSLKFPCDADTAGGVIMGKFSLVRMQSCFPYSTKKS